jgi:RNA ligase (TIGR02306 family)
MSTFKVTVEKISEVKNHSNADRLDIAKVSGMDFQFVVGRDEYKVGDLCIYFPLDSLLPEKITTALNLSGKLAGKDMNRIKTVKLRGEISQGIAANPKTLNMSFTDNDIGKDLTAEFGVEKYDPEPVACYAGNLVPLPDGLGVYDIEGADRFQDVLEILLPQRVSISEKIEGQNFSTTVYNDGREFVNQRNYSIQEIEGQEHDLWKIARKLNFLEISKELCKKLNTSCDSLRGEYAGPGIQKNICKFKQNEVFLFDIKTDKGYLEPDTFLNICKEYNFKTVPILAHNVILSDWLIEKKTIKEASNGKSVLADVLREGIVIKPMVEQYNDKIGRLIIKQRSPNYLAKYDT